jgi:NADPH-dependent 2,4-dienoyl-CoA reductase/sulfur reductase-like enzyme
MRKVDLAIIGCGVAGMAAAGAAYDAGISDIIIFENDDKPGGVLGQCIHAGFGLHTFGEELTGPEFSARFEKMIADRGIDVMFSSPVLEIRPDRTLKVCSAREGELEFSAKAIVLATGCRERPAGAIGIPGQRPAGVLTAGTAQRYINLEGYMVGKRAVILGSGDIGLIMARRLSLEGAEVVCVCELMPYSNGLNRNIVQCLEDYNIPLYLSTTVTGIEGVERLTGVWISDVDPQTKRPIAGSERFVECDTLLLSVGLIPETGLLTDADGKLGPNRGVYVDQNRQSSIEGIFACGNVVQVHDLVDFVADEGKTAGAAAAAYLLGKMKKSEKEIKVAAGSGVTYVVPEEISAAAGEVELFFRVARVFKKAKAVCRAGQKEILRRARPTMLPGEMEKLKIDISALENGCDAITVEVEA